MSAELPTSFTNNLQQNKDPNLLQKLGRELANRMPESLAQHFNKTSVIIEGAQQDSWRTFHTARFDQYIPKDCTTLRFWDDDLNLVGFWTPEGINFIVSNVWNFETSSKPLDQNTLHGRTCEIQGSFELSGHIQRARTLIAEDGKIFINMSLLHSSGHKRSRIPAFLQMVWDKYNGQNPASKESAQKSKSKSSSQKLLT